LKASAVLMVSTYALKANLSLGSELMLRGVNDVKAYAKADWSSGLPCSKTTPGTGKRKNEKTIEYKLVHILERETVYSFHCGKRAINLKALLGDPPPFPLANIHAEEDPLTQ